MRGWLGGVLVLLACGARAASPELPRNSIDTTYRTSAITTVVGNGGNFQNALNAAVLGDTITLNAGSTYTGNFTLPNKGAGSSYITIRTSTVDGSFPQPGVRVSPGDAGVMAKLTAGSGSILAAENGAHNYRFIGIEITPSAYLTNIVDLAPPSGLLADMPSYLIFDRVYIHGHATNGSRRGIAMNSSWTAVVDSYISECMEVGADSQAIASWKGPGPFKIINNYLSGAGENVLFGGADSPSAVFIPSDIEFRRNYLFKPLSWKVGDPAYAGTHWSIKNSFELKTGQRLLIENNLIENCWGDGQTGISILFTVRNQDGTAPWSVVQDVTFRNNLILNTDGGLNMLSEDSGQVSQTVRRVSITNNLWKGIGAERYHQLITNDVGFVDLSITYDTGFFGDTVLLYLTGALVNTKNSNFEYSYTIGAQNSYGVFADGGAQGTNALNAYNSPYTFSKNVLIGTDNTGTYPAGQYWPADNAAVNFVNYGGGNYRLTPASTYTGLTPNGRDLGAFFPSVGQTAFTASLDASGTVGVLRFGMPGLLATTSCTIRYGASSTTSASGPATRYQVITGLTPGSTYGVTVDCGDAAGAVIWTDVVASSPSGGNRTIPISLKATSVLSTAARVTVDYGTTTSVADGSVQNTSCSAGCTVNLTIPAGLRYWRARWQTSGDVVIATSDVQPLVIQ